MDFDVYVAKPVPCPYLPGRTEGKLLVPLDGDDPAARYDVLIEHGFRRSHRWAYRPRCQGCLACWPVRIDVTAFVPSRSQRRARNRCRELRLESGPARGEACDGAVLRAYVERRHRGGVMAEMADADFLAMIDDTSVRSEVWRLRDGSGQVVAVMLVDVVATGLSLVYSGFRPDVADLGVGTFWVLLAVDEARRRGLRHVYLGYLVEGCRKMEYKAGFGGLEILDVEGWGRVGRRTPRDRAELEAAAAAGYADDTLDAPEALAVAVGAVGNVAPSASQAPAHAACADEGVEVR